MNLESVFLEIQKEVQPSLSNGKLSNVIPTNTQFKEDKFGLYLLNIDGSSYNIGDWKDRFSIQSITKVFMLTLAMVKCKNELYKRVGVEPSGTSFHSLIQLEYEKGIPRNPFINAGALVITDILLSMVPDIKNEFLQYIRDISGCPNIEYNKFVANFERKNSFKNAAMVDLMKSYGNIDNNPNDVLDLYCHFCSVEMNCQELAKAFRVFANHGKGIVDSRKYLEEIQYKRIVGLMLTCGLYDESGVFAYKVGLPAKSGIGGGIVAIKPNQYSIVVWSPKLNEKGNSLSGLKAFELFSTKTQSSIF